eukprot:469864-Prorocentrum_minimum.AAC.2
MGTTALDFEKRQHLEEGKVSNDAGVEAESLLRDEQRSKADGCVRRQIRHICSYWQSISLTGIGPTRFHTASDVAYNTKAFSQSRSHVRSSLQARASYA